MDKIVYCAVLILMSAVRSVIAAPEVRVAPGKPRDYYHLRFAINPENCELTVPLSERRPKCSKSNEFSFSEGGQFEVFIRKAAFPVPAPKTEREFLILRMPWTNPEHKHASEFIAEKRELFNRIFQMKTAGTGSVAISVELNPVGSKNSSAPNFLENSPTRCILLES